MPRLFPSPSTTTAHTATRHNVNWDDDVEDFDMTDKEKRELLARLVDENIAILNKAQAEHRDLMSVEKVKADNATKEASEPARELWGKKIDEFRSFAEWARSSDPDDDRVIRSTLDGGGSSGACVNRASGKNDRSYRNMFPDISIDRGGFDSFREFAQYVSLGFVDDRVKRSLVEGEGSKGGFVVPTEYSKRFLTYR